VHSIPQSTTIPTEIKPVWEPHYSVNQLAKQWGFGRTTIRRWFENEPGVLSLGERRLRRNRKRPYISLRIPESVAVAVYNRHLKA